MPCWSSGLPTVRFGLGEPADVVGARSLRVGRPTDYLGARFPHRLTTLRFALPPSLGHRAGETSRGYVMCSHVCPFLG